MHLGAKWPIRPVLCSIKQLRVFVLYKRRTKLKDIKLTDIYPSYASAINTSRLFINENLTNFRRHLLGRANGMKRDGLLLSAWTIDGKVFVKTSPDGAPVRIFCDADLDEL